MMFLKKSVFALLVPLWALLSGGCATTHNLTMKADLPPIDRSVLSPKLKEKKFTKIIVIPPSGTVRGTFEPKIVLFEREFLRQGMTVISGAITGRIVMDAVDKPNEKKGEAARDLSDMERALVMARNTGAEAILQLGEYKWDLTEKLWRYFIADAVKDSDFRETDNKEWKDINRWVTVKPWQREAMEHAEAKLIAYVASLLSPK